jgi:glycerol-3-phosphate acyltransferase PlsY
MKVFLVLLASYLFGSIPWALVIGKVFYHKDIRKEGSGNLGASNAGRVLGKPAAISVTLLDAFKGFFAMMLAYFVCPEVTMLAGLTCAFGHCFPLFAGFKGGKAVATTYGLFLGIVVFLNGHWFWNFVWPIVLFFGILYLCRIVSISSLSAILIEVITTIFVNHDKMITIPLLILWLFILYRHRSNLVRIKNGTENRIKWMG